MQGMLDLKMCQWVASNNSLVGISEVIQHDSYEIVIANNGYQIKRVNVNRGVVKIVNLDHDLSKLVIQSDENKQIHWEVKYELQL
ncbi:hypothetical protein MY04_4381 [Flammeovirga sp. MY04]|uniref:hypothetical protein n=1 Tax=Flammeovirga sp. MY04 TaxID=1191459 RepID=UPI00080638A4|nr:hypothetical protein [Flammeovirga sp. MY04]ANQ51719.1 hypothetical protein MY04_4381 [Flammeovirga sp. MY04]